MVNKEPHLPRTTFSNDVSVDYGGAVGHLLSIYFAYSTILAGLLFTE